MSESFPIERDTTYPAMWRVVLPNGKRSDMGNLTRIADAAKVLWRAAQKKEDQ